MPTPRGRGEFLKAKCLEAMYENKPEFIGGMEGCIKKSLSWEEHGYFLELHIKCSSSLFFCCRLAVSYSSSSMFSSYKEKVYFLSLTNGPLLAVWQLCCHILRNKLRVLNCKRKHNVLNCN